MSTPSEPPFTLPEGRLAIVELRVENVKKIVAITVRPNGHLVTIGGANGAGKSSVLDSIAWGLAGKKVSDPQLIRRGESEANVSIDLGAIIIERKRLENGTESLKIRPKNKRGSFTSPQALLDGLTSQVCFDPLEFAALEREDRVDVLRRLTGLDFAEEEAEAKRLYDERTDVNRHAREQEALLAGLSNPPVEPALDTRQDGSALSATLANADALRREADLALEAATNGQSSLVRMRNLRNQLAEQQGALNKHIEELEKKLAEARDALSGVERRIKDGVLLIAQAEKQQAELDARAQQSRARIPDVGATVLQLEAIRVANELADTRRQERERYATECAKLNGYLRQSGDLTRALEHIEKTKAQKLRAAKMPVDGLSFTSAGVLFNGIPFEQASDGEKIVISTAIGAALNPKMAVMLVRRGSLLDEKGKAVLLQEATRLGLQIWLELVSAAEDVQVLIEDGMRVR